MAGLCKPYMSHDVPSVLYGTANFGIHDGSFFFGVLNVGHISCNPMECLGIVGLFRFVDLPPGDLGSSGFTL